MKIAHEWDAPRTAPDVSYSIDQRLKPVRAGILECGRSAGIRHADPPRPRSAAEALRPLAHDRVEYMPSNGKMCNPRAKRGRQTDNRAGLHDCWPTVERT